MTQTTSGPTDSAQVQRLVAALVEWEAAQERFRSGVPTKASAQAFREAREAWIDAQSAVPEDQGHATWLEALRVHHGRVAEQADAGHLNRSGPSAHEGSTPSAPTTSTSA